MREMKDSGIEWIGEIPEEWEIVKLDFIAEKITDYVASGSFASLNANVKYLDEPDYAMLIRTVDLNGDKDGKHVYIDEDAYNFLSNSNLYGGEIILSNIGSVGNVFIYEPMYEKASLAPNSILVNMKESNRFYYYWFLNPMVNDALKHLGNDSVQIKFNKTQLRAFIVAHPSYEEQLKIADFLDDKCAEIDALTADIETQIDTLEQYKRSVITEAVTKGMDPDAEMKDSGVEWLGMIPASWTLLRGKYLFQQRNNRGNNLNLQLLSPTQKFGVIPQDMYEDLSGMSTVKLNEKADLNLMKTIHMGDFCISLRSFQGGFEYSEYEGVVSPAYQVFYPSVDISDGYYKYLFKERSFIEKMNSYTMTLIDGKDIAFSDFGNIYIPYPPVEEQRSIFEYLDNKCSEIDSIISDKRTQLETLADYKKSLIYEYVTGKKEVPAS